MNQVSVSGQETGEQTVRWMPIDEEPAAGHSKLFEVVLALLALAFFVGLFCGVFTPRPLDTGTRGPHSYVAP